MRVILRYHIREEDAVQQHNRAFLDKAAYSSAAGGARRLRDAAGSVPPTGLVLLSTLSVQLGAAVAKNLFPALSPAGAVLLRVGFGAIILLALRRSRLRGYARADYLAAVLFGLTTAGMNYAFYSALDRIPLGVAVTIEFVGPLGVALAGSRRLTHALWGLLALAGILLFSPIGGAQLDPLGMALALLAGVLWGAYILLGARMGRVFPGGTGLTLAMIVGGLALLPVGLAGAGKALLDPGLLLAGVGLALLSAVVPYSLEIEALRRLPARVFGVLMSVEPAVATVIGFVVLGERLGLRDLTAIVLVVVASIGASRAAHDK